MSFSIAIRNYIHGIILVLLAGLILNVISYISLFTSDIVISPANNMASSVRLLYESSGNTYTRTRVGGYITGIYASPSPNIAASGSMDIILVADVSELSFVFGNNPQPVLVWSCDDPAYSGEDPNPARYNESIIYTRISIPKDVTLINVGVKSSDSGAYLSGYVRFYIYQANSISDIFSNTTSNTHNITVSTGLFINFISWLAGIILVIKVMHKFGIPI